MSVTPADYQRFFIGGYGWNYGLGYKSCRDSSIVAATITETKPQRVSRPSLTYAIGDTIDWGTNVMTHCSLYNPTTTNSIVG